MTITRGSVSVTVGRGSWLCLDCWKVKLGRTMNAERCFSCAHRHKQIRLKG
jgi:hypothetical protein